MPFGYDAESLGYDSTQSFLSESLKEVFIWPLLLVVYFGLTALYPELWGISIVNQIVLSSVDLIVLAIGITFVLAAGEIDLSLVGTMGVAPYIATWAITEVGAPLLAIFVVIPVVCIVIGLGNSYLVNSLELDSLIATLGTYFFLIGVLFALTEGATVTGFGGTYTYIGNTSIAGINLLIPAIVLIAAVSHFVLSRHPFGRNLLLTGGDEDSASRSGIDTEQVRRYAFITCALLAGAAGFLLSSRLAIISSTFGQGRLLPAIAAPILGGVHLTGGKAQIHQAIGGALLLQMINTCLTIAGVSGYHVRLYTGILVLVAIVVGSLRIMAE